MSGGCPKVGNFSDQKWGISVIAVNDTPNDCCELGKRCCLLAFGIAPCRIPAENPFRYTKNPLQASICDP